MDSVMRLASQRPVVIFTTSSCCMCHTVKTLFTEMGVNVAVNNLDEVTKGKEMERALLAMLGGNSNGRRRPVPVVFIGGKLVGSTEKIMSLHLTGNLVQMLREAGALWL